MNQTIDRPEQHVNVDRTLASTTLRRDPNSQSSKKKARPKKKPWTKKKARPTKGGKPCSAKPQDNPPNQETDQTPPAADPPPDGTLHVFTDGSSLRNGKVEAFAGVGVYFGPRDPRYVRLHTDFTLINPINLLSKERIRTFTRYTPDKSTRRGNGNHSCIGGRFQAYSCHGLLG